MKMRLFIKKVITLLLVVAMTASISRTAAFAADTVDHHDVVKVAVKVGEKFLNSEGHLESVIRINEDGSFFTEEYNRNTAKTQKTKCSHPSESLKAIAELDPETENVKKDYCCFRYRSRTEYRCKKCGATIILHGVWKSHKKHNFPLFGRTCRTCGYKK